MSKSHFSKFTKLECQKILEKKLTTTSFTVSGFKFYEVQEECKGYFGEHYRLHITYKSGGEELKARFFAKAIPLAKLQRDFINENGIFMKECLFFKEFIPKLLEREIHIISEAVAPCYLIAENQYLIFEDLDVNNYISLDYRVGLSMDCLKTGLDALAKVHAAGFIFEEQMKEEIGGNFRLGEIFPKIFKESFFPNTSYGNKWITEKFIPSLIDLFCNEHMLDVNLFKKVGVEVFAQFKEMVRPSTSYRNTLCHGDLWVGNFMFKFKDDKPVHCFIIDFQTFRYGPPAQDLMCYLYLTMDRKLRQEHMDVLIEYYFEKLYNALKAPDRGYEKIMTFHEFSASCDFYELFASAIAVNHQPLIMLPKEDSIDSLIKKMEYAMFVDKSALTQELCSKNEVYKRKMQDVLLDFRDVLIKRKQIQLKSNTVKDKKVTGKK